MDNSKLQIVAVNVEGDPETIREVLRQADRILSGKSEPAAAIPAATALPSPLPSPASGRGRKKQETLSSDEKPFPCRKCGKGCATPQGRSKHENACDGNGDKGAPSESRSFMSPERFAADSSSTKVKPFQCDRCGARSVSKAGVHLHKLRAHGGKE